jgi:hypothetical protein
VGLGGGRFQKYFQTPPEGLFADKKREEVPEAGILPSQWAGGTPPGRWAGGAPVYFFVIFFGIYILQTI